MNESCDESKPLILNTVDLPNGDKLIVRKSCLSDAEGLTKKSFLHKPLRTQLRVSRLFGRKDGYKLLDKLETRLLGMS